LQPLVKWIGPKKEPVIESYKAHSEEPLFEKIEPATEKEKAAGKVALGGGTWGKTFLALTHPAQAQEQLSQFREEAKKLLNKTKLFRPEGSPTPEKTSVAEPRVKMGKSKK
jgi:hypothetical protein